MVDRTSDKRYCTCFYMGPGADVRPDHSPDCMLKQPPLPTCGGSLPSKQSTIRDLVSDLVGCALIEGAQPTASAERETRAAKQRVLDAIEEAHADETRASETPALIEPKAWMPAWLREFYCNCESEGEATGQCVACQAADLIESHGVVTNSVRDSIAPNKQCPKCKGFFWLDKFDGHDCRPLKAAVLPTEICPTGDDYPHKAHEGKCMYCGAPMNGNPQV